MSILRVNDKIQFWDQGTQEYIKGTIADIQYMESYFHFATINYYANKKQRTVRIYREDWIVKTVKALSPGN